jgi:Tfp pilus assembly protein PilX
MLPRILSVDQRIHDSEKFPRIASAEAAMRANERRLQNKYGNEFVSSNNVSISRKLPSGKNKKTHQSGQG